MITAKRRKVATQAKPMNPFEITDNTEELMKNLSSNQLRELRNKFRESKQHKYIPEASLIAS